MIAPTSESVRRIVVVGGGTAGMLSAIAMRKKFPAEIDVVVVRSTRLGVIGVGEGTIPSVVQFLHNFLGIEHRELHQRAEPSIKLGIRYLWGSRPYFNYTFSSQLVRPGEWFEYPNGYYCDEDFRFANVSAALMEHDRVWLRRGDGRPAFNTNFAYHFENRKFVAYLEDLADQLGIPKIDDVVDEVLQDESGISELVLESGQRVKGDLFLDCSGFPSLLLGQALGESTVDFGNALFCDRAVVGGWDRTDEPYHPYTTAETMDSGWCWRIEHDDIVNRGYVFCSQFISDEQAIEEFRKKNPRTRDPRVIRFPAGARRRLWVRNVVAIGNSAGFVEPLEATAIGMICDSILSLVKALKASNFQVVPIQRDVFNRTQFENWEIIRDFLALHYKFNHRLDTPFWQAARHDVDLGEAQEFADYYQAVGPDFGLLTQRLKRDFFSAEGYLAMLVGQQVPYQSTIQISQHQRDKWKLYLANLDTQARNGVPMMEYLQWARTSDLPLDALKGGSVPRRVGTPSLEGQLNWH